MVELKKKVTLKTKVAETVTPNQQESRQTNPSNNGKGKKFGGLMLLAVIAVVGFFLLLPKNSDNELSVSSQMTSESIAQKTDKDLTQEAEQPILNEEESTPVVDENKSSNETSENNDNKSKTVSEQEDKFQTTTETKTPTIETTSKIIPTREKTLAGTIEEKAKSVIRGDFGNGEERKIKLGSEYSVIQNKVNEMYAKGLVY